MIGSVQFLRWFYWYILLAIACLLPSVLRSQNLTVPQLREQLKQPLHDTTRARIYGQLAWELKFTNNAEAFKMADEEMQWAHGNPLHLADAYRTQALILVIENKLARGLSLYDSALYYAQKANSYYYQSSCYSLIAGMHQDLGDYDKALSFYFKGLDAAITGKQDAMLGALYNNIASVYAQAGRSPRQALRYYEKALAIAIATKRDAFAGLICANMASELLQLNQRDSAELFATKSLQYANKNGTRGYEYAASLVNVANIYVALNRLSEAENRLKESIALLDSLKRPINVLNPLSALCNLYLQQNKIAEAEKLAGRLLRDAEFYKTKAYIRDAYKVLSEIAGRRNNGVDALKYMKQYSIWSDSVYNETREKSMADVQSRADLAQREMEVKYATGQKAQENKILKLQNSSLRMVVIAAVVIALLLSAMAFLIFRANVAKERANRSLAEKNSLIEVQSKEKDLLMMEIHHRVKNNLQIVSSLLNLQANTITDENAREALLQSRNRVRSIALVHQKLYTQSDLSAISLHDYILQLASYLKNIYSAPLIEVSCTTTPIDLKLDLEKTIPLGLIMNELITNSIKYAGINKADGLITIQLAKTGTDTCTLQYSDNGIGLPGNFDIKSAGTLGMRMVYELSRQLQGTLTYKNTSGAVFTIVFPIR